MKGGLRLRFRSLVDYSGQILSFFIAETARYLRFAGMNLGSNYRCRFNFSIYDHSDSLMQMMSCDFSKLLPPRVVERNLDLLIPTPVRVKFCGLNGCIIQQNGFINLQYFLSALHLIRHEFGVVRRRIQHQTHLKNRCLQRSGRLGGFELLGQRFHHLGVLLTML